MSLIETLDRWEMQMIAEFLSPFDILLLRASCALCATCIEIRACIDEHDPDWMIYEAAKRGHRNLCVLARELVRISCSNITEDLATLLQAHGNRHVLNKVTHKVQSRYLLDLNMMLCGAAKGGHRDLCILARDWTRETPLDCDDEQLNYDNMLARDWARGTPLDYDDDQLNYDNMLWCAAGGGHRELCELAREWGATDLNWMLRCAAEGGHRDLCELARGWMDAEGINPNFRDMLSGATEGGHSEMCVLAREWMAPHRKKITERKHVSQHTHKK